MMIHPFGDFGDPTHERNGVGKGRKLERSRDRVAAACPPGACAECSLDFDVGKFGHPRRGRAVSLKHTRRRQSRLYSVISRKSPSFLMSSAGLCETSAILCGPKCFDLSVESVIVVAAGRNKT